MSPQRAAWIAFGAALAVTVVLWLSVRVAERARAEEDVRARAGALASRVTDRLRSYELLLKGGDALFGATGEVSAPNLRGYLGGLGLARSHPGLLSVGLAMASTSSVEPAVPTPTGALGWRLWAPVTVVLGSGNPGALPTGSDLLADASQRAALLHALPTGAPVLLAAGSAGAPGPATLILTLPLFAPEVPAADTARSTQDPDSRLRGWIFATFALDALLSPMSEPPAPPLEVTLFAGPQIRPSDLVYRSANTSPLSSSGGSSAERCTALSRAEVAGGAWTLCALASEPRGESLGAVLVLLLGLSGSAGLLLWGRVLLRGAPPAAPRMGLVPLQPLLDTLPQPVAVLDRQGRLMLVNRAYGEMAGCPSGELIGQRPVEHLGDARAQLIGLADAAEAALAEREVGWTGPEGEVRWLAWYRRPLSDKPQPTLGVVWTAYDLSGARASATQAAQLLQGVLDSLPFPLLVRRADGGVLNANTALCRLLGRDREELLGARCEVAEPEVNGRGLTEEAVRRHKGEEIWGRRSHRAVPLPGVGPIYVEALAEADSQGTAREAGGSEAQPGLLNVISRAVSGREPLGGVLGATVLALAGEFPDFEVFYAVADAQGVLTATQAAGSCRVHLANLQIALAQAPDWRAALQRGRPLVASDVGSAGGLGEVLAHLRAAGVAALLQYPVLCEDQLHGTIGFALAHPHSWAPAEVSRLGGVAATLEVICHGARAEQVRLQAEQALRESERKLQLAVSTSGVGLWRLDLASGSFEGSPLWRDLLGISALGAPSHLDQWLELVHPEDRSRIWAYNHDIRAGKAIHFEVEYRARHGDGSYRWLLSRGRVERRPDGRAASMFGGHIDITPLKQTQEALRQHRDNMQQLVDERTAQLRAAKDAAEGANLAKSQFLANMSHELRTPMHAILSFARLGMERLQEAEPNVAKLKQYLARITGGGERLLGLLNDLLDLSKLEAGKMGYRLAETDLEDLVRDVAAEMEAMARHRQVNLVVIRPEVATLIWGDRDRIGQVVRNLLTNALKFSPEGSEIRVCFTADALPEPRHESDQPVRDAVRVTVRDSGIGIPEDELEMVFESFVQSSQTSSGAGGTGLGLAICREIIDHHRGVIWAENNPTGGASVNFALPRAPAPLSPAVARSGSPKEVVL